MRLLPQPSANPASSEDGRHIKDLIQLPGGIISPKFQSLLRHIVLPPLTIALLSFVSAALAVGWLSRRRVALDQPNARSLHEKPVPRTGGIGLILGVAAGWTIAGPDFPWPVWAGLALLFGISLLDDLRGLPAIARLLAHLAAAALAVWALLGTGSPAAVLVAAALAAGWMCNLYNFMDGSDGLAGGMTIIGFSAYAAAAWMIGSDRFALANLAVAAAAAGFLIHNFHPARIFLGDAGSVPLGFLAAVSGLAGWQQDSWPWWFPLLVFSPFIADASVTLVRRLLAGARIWEAHRDHYYQRLVRLGLGHRGTALSGYALMAACAAAALSSLRADPLARHAILAGFVLAYLLLTLAIELAWRRRPDGT